MTMTTIEKTIPDEVLQVDQVLALLGCSRRHLVRLCETGAIPKGVWFRLTEQGRRLFNRAELDAWRLKGGAAA